MTGDERRPPKSLTSPVRAPADAEYEERLRPETFDDFVGQERLVGNLKVFIEAALRRKEKRRKEGKPPETLDHVILSGPPGLGKTTLASIIARSMDAEMRVTSGPAVERPADITGILSKLSVGSVLFIDEVHRLPKTVEEYLYSAMEDFAIDIVLERGVGARSVRLTLSRFTLVGATTRLGLLSSPFLERFGISLRLNYYSREELARIVRRSAGVLEVTVEPDGALEIASRSRGTPRIANRLLRRVRDFAQVEGDGVVTQTLAKRALSLLEVDERGLDDMDVRVLDALVRVFKGRAVGLKTLARAVGEDPGTLEEVIEPFLIREGLLTVTGRGRVATRRAFEHLGARPDEGLW